jgi:hypothetical protein
VKDVQTASAAHSSTYPMGTEVSFRVGRLKRPGREADHPHPFTDDIRNAWS